MNQYMENFDKSTLKYLSFLDNIYIQTIIAFILIIYAAFGAPILSKNVAQIFDNNWFRLLLFFIIVIIAVKSPAIAIIAAIAIIISIMTLNKYKSGEMMGSITKKGKNMLVEGTYRGSRCVTDEDIEKLYPPPNYKKKKNKMTSKDLSEEKWLDNSSYNTIEETNSTEVIGMPCKNTYSLENLELLNNNPTHIERNEIVGYS
jgi:hypothetical protein